jgi:hypothetical protein
LSVRSLIRHPKDFWTGVIFLVAGGGAVIICQDYPMGSAGRMGPGYFPTVLGGLLALVGLIGVVRAFLHDGEAIEKFAVKELILVLTGVLLFGFLVRGAGLVPAIVVLVVLSAFAGPKFRLTHVGLLAAGLAAFSVLIFVKLLGLPILAIGPWFGH